MATQPAVAARVARADAAAWRAWHLFYHADRERLVAELVRPTIAELRADGHINGFYFIRYDLGGPHVRLRLRPARGRAAQVAAKVRDAAEAFFARRPSTRSIPAEAIVRRNTGIVASDPQTGGAADEVYPDNSIREFAPLFEVDRYGGPGLFPHSLEFFTLSSHETFRFVSAEQERAAGQRLAIAGRLCVDQAWGFARDGDEFTELVAYPSRLFTGAWTERFIQRGDEAFDRNRAVHTRLLRDELRALTEGASGRLSPALAGGARRLARRVRGEEEGTKWTIGSSQLHMTANRLGLLNPEELYLGQILGHAARALSAEEPEFWRGVWTRRRARTLTV